VPERVYTSAIRPAGFEDRMAGKILTEMKEWIALQKHYEEMKNVTLKALFESDARRGHALAIDEGEIYFDYSKHRVSDTTIGLLLNLARARGLGNEIERMFRGEKINETEDRAVLHIALRNITGNSVSADGVDVMPEVRSVIGRMKEFSDRVRGGRWKGYTGKPVRNIVNIGIGGSDLGPCMVAEALKYYSKRELKSFFVSNIDASHIMETIRGLNPEETLFLIAS
jgi:glucose-6-phosphate isomerase